MNALNELPLAAATPAANNSNHLDLARADVVYAIGLIRDNGARLTAYLLARLAAKTDAENQICTEGLERCIAPIELAIDALLGKTHIDSLDTDALNWMRAELQSDPDCLASVQSLAKYMRVFLSQIEAGTNPDLDQIFASLEIVRSSFIGNFSAFVSRLQDSIHEDRSIRIAGIQDSASRAKRGVDRIGEIARTVRMVSINAQIEAARAGDRGRAFSIIAQEINALSDEISAVGQDVQDGLQDTLRRT